MYDGFYFYKILKFREEKKYKNRRTKRKKKTLAPVAVWRGRVDRTVFL
jgi:hypothetical protein